jgi:predicted nucleic acid-binding protein
MIYWDTSYLAKLYLREAGTDEVLHAFAGQGGFVCAEHGRLELLAAFKRNQREGLLSAARLKTVWEKHEQDQSDGLVEYLPLSSPLIQHACQTLFLIPPTIFLRAADALHLACAAEHGCKEVYSHDRHLLAAAPHFGLRGIDVIASP